MNNDFIKQLELLDSQAENLRKVQREAKSTLNSLVAQIPTNERSEVTNVMMEMNKLEKEGDEKKLKLLQDKLQNLIKQYATKGNQ